MARKRNIDPASWRHEKIAGLSIGAHLLWIGTLSMADDDGRVKWTVRQIRLDIFADKPEATDDAIARWMAELEQAGAITPYMVNGKSYAFHPDYRDHQYINKPAKSSIPSPPADLIPQLSLGISGTSQFVPQKDGYRFGSVRFGSESLSISDSSETYVSAGSGEEKASSPPDESGGVPVRPYDPPVLPSNLPADLPADVVELEEVAVHFVRPFANCRTEGAVKKHLPPYIDTLAAFRGRGTTTAQAWQAFCDARRAAGRPLFGFSSKQALNYSPPRPAYGRGRSMRHPDDGIQKRPLSEIIGTGWVRNTWPQDDGDSPAGVA